VDFCYINHTPGPMTPPPLQQEIALETNLSFQYYRGLWTK